MGVLNFIVKEIFGQGAIFLAMIAMIGLIIQKKNVGEIIRGTFMTAIGFFVLNRGVGIVSEVVSGLSAAFTSVMRTSSSSGIGLSWYPAIRDGR